MRDAFAHLTNVFACSTTGETTLGGSTSHSTTTLQALEPNESPAVSTPSILSYKMSRSTHTIKEIWNEYQNGICGAPSIRFLNITYGNKWRATNTESKHYSRRLPIYRAISLLVDEGLSEIDAVNLMTSQKGNTSLVQFAISLSTVLSNKEQAKGLINSNTTST